MLQTQKKFKIRKFQKTRTGEFEVLHERRPNKRYVQLGQAMSACAKLNRRMGHQVVLPKGTTCMFEMWIDEGATFYMVIDSN